ncbi:hypothetical protein NEPAR06_2098 [Nematocida parisii]|nr:hypothetical protein NEPAR07_1853 [Nematocida parisii]KAI5155977.1 hypothetical protein NEPAR06_2098 [Nematocida parisii]KAI5158418.1 hypothetical protein NEPAR05_1961 [Nematocida parisii]
MERLPIISEIYGDKNSGRSEFCYYMAQNVNSLWIESCKRTCTKTADSLMIDLNSMHICKIEYVHLLVNKLKTNEIQCFIKDHKVNLLVINNLDDFLADCTERKWEYAELVKNLKLLYITHSVKSIIITQSRPEQFKPVVIGNRPMWSTSTDNKSNEYAQEEDERGFGININIYNILKRYKKEKIPKSTAESALWNMCMPTRFYIEKTPAAEIRILKVIKPKLASNPEYILNATPTRITMKRIEPSDN